MNFHAREISNSRLLPGISAMKKLLRENRSLLLFLLLPRGDRWLKSISPSS